MQNKLLVNLIMDIEEDSELQGIFAAIGLDPNDIHDFDPNDLQQALDNASPETIKQISKQICSGI